MLFKFVGDYTNGHTSITMGGVRFDGREPSNVTDEDGIRRLSGNPEFVEVHQLDHDGDGEPGGSLAGEKATARKRGRPKKETE